MQSSITAHASLIDKLERAITHGTDAVRKTTLRQVTDLFAVHADRLTEDQVALFDEVMQRLIEEIETRALVELSERLAPIGTAPCRVVRQLAFHDEIEVARPLLARSERICEADLIAIAETKSQAHLLAISARNHLSELITSVLVSRGDIVVSRSLAGNHGASLSQTDITILSDRAETDRALADRLVLRADIPLHIFCRLLARATEIVVRRLLDGARADQQATIRRVVSRIAGEIATEAADPDRFAAALRSVHLMYMAGLLDEHKLLALASAKRSEEAIVALSTLCPVPVAVADRIVGCRHIEPLLILCRAADLKWPTVRALVQLRPRDHHVTAHLVAELWHDFQKFPPTAARTLIEHWQAREPVH
jgi:uncharacterized protein (DUF2336 family)